MYGGREARREEREERNGDRRQGDGGKKEGPEVPRHRGTGAGGGARCAMRRGRGAGSGEERRGGEEVRRPTSRCEPTSHERRETRDDETTSTTSEAQCHCCQFVSCNFILTTLVTERRLAITPAGPLQFCNSAIAQPGVKYTLRAIIQDARAVDDVGSRKVQYCEYASVHP